MAEQAFIDRTSNPTEKLEVLLFSNKEPSKNVDLSPGTIQFNYYESLFSDTIKADLTFIDSGDSVGVERGGSNVSVYQGLPLVGTERVEVVMKDNKQVAIGESPKLKLYVNKINPQLSDNQRNMVGLSLVSKEYLMDKKTNVNERFDGKISDTIGVLLVDDKFIGTEKNVDIESTSNNFNFIGNNKHPMYLMNWLSKKSVSEQNQTIGESAGYFLYETYDGFKFKSIDGLFAQKPKKSYIYNNTELLPAGYDGKALTYKKDNNVHAESKFKFGAYHTRAILFDPFTTFYEVREKQVDQEQLTMGGKELPTLNPEFEKELDSFTRTSYFVLDTGTMPAGTSEQQLEKSKEENFPYADISNQANQRYNQFVSAKASITISGDFSLRAGDAIFLDVPKLESEQTTTIDPTDGGLYIITELCHFISTKGTFTKLNLVRDSFGRSGNHTLNRTGVA